MIKSALSVVVLLLVVKWLFDYAGWLGYYQRVYNHTPGDCRKLQELEFGSEDIQVLPNGLAFISSGLRLANNDVYNRRPGRIFTFNFNKPDEPARELAIKADQDFKLISTHGLSIWVNPATGDTYLYVISHLPVETVDKFLYNADTNSLTHVRRITGDKNFHQLNDLVVVGNDQFYFTNYFYSSFMREFFLRLPWASLGFYDVTSSRLMDEGLFVANGIALSPDKRFLYVAELGDEDIRVYERSDNNSVKYLHSIDVQTKLDNLDVDMSTGDLWTGAHPIALGLFKYIEDPFGHSPSQVLRLRMSNGKATSIDEVYANDGSFLAGSSVAVVYGKAMLMGTVAGPALYCQLN